MDRQAIQERFEIIGNSPALHQVIDRAFMVARTDITVLLQGESGVGKELIAHAIHDLSGRKHRPLVIVNCGAIPEGLIESELFGAEKGAYTGAVERRTGYFEEANGGTVFLDEIGEMPPAAQVRLLRVLESGEFTRVGSSTARHSDARIIAATNKDLAREVEAGRFREDLYYRLSTVIIRIPPLRERREDILPLFESFVHRSAQKYNTTSRRLDASARELLTRYHWPGNVRELRNVAEQVVVLLREDPVSAEKIRPFLRGVSAGGGLGADLVHVRSSQPSDTPEARERELIYRALLELRMEVRDLKEQIREMSGNVVVPREIVEQSTFEGKRPDFVIVRDNDRSDYASMIEDVPYEIQSEDENGEGDGERTSMPTLEDAERRLIAEALRRFDGNRRQTARALGISERTLYRKLKEFEEDL
ncbi:MAG TPA: sigma-54 dependent transcriptional regulator [Rhodothermales bacterium]